MLLRLFLLLLLVSPVAAREWNDLSIHQPNWVGRAGEGSCGHASMIACFRFQDRDDWGVWWRQHHGDGVTPGTSGQWGLEGYLLRAKVPYYATFREKDAAFLDWASEHKLGVGVAVHGRAHMVTILKTTPTHICIVDNNQAGKLLWYNRQEWLNHWYESDSWAVTPVLRPGIPPPPGKRHYNEVPANHLGLRVVVQR